MNKDEYPDAFEEIQEGGSDNSSKDWELTNPKAANKVNELFTSKCFRRTKTRKQMKYWVVYPEEVWRTRWELFIALSLLFICVKTPLSLAFDHVDESVT